MAALPHPPLREGCVERAAAAAQRARGECGAAEAVIWACAAACARCGAADQSSGLRRLVPCAGRMFGRGVARCPLGPLSRPPPGRVGVGIRGLTGGAGGSEPGGGVDWAPGYVGCVALSLAGTGPAQGVDSLCCCSNCYRAVVAVQEVVDEVRVAGFVGC